MLDVILNCIVITNSSVEKSFYVVAHEFCSRGRVGMGLLTIWYGSG